MIVGRITANAGTTVPPEVQRALGVVTGDELSWEIDGDRAVVRRVADQAKWSAAGSFVADLSRFDEWASVADQRAFADL